MKQYYLPFSLFRRFRFQYFEKSRNQINDSVLYHGHRRICAPKCTNLRRYSSGFLGVNRIPTNVDDDIHSGGASEVYQNNNYAHQLGQPSDGYRNEGYGLNSGQSQHLSNPRNEGYGLNSGQSQHLSNPRNEGYGLNSGQSQHLSNPRNHYPSNDMNLQNIHSHKPGYFSGGNVEPGSNGYHQANSSYSAGYPYNNGQPVTYQQNVGVQSGSNSYHQVNYNFNGGNPSGYYNGQWGSNEQNFVGSHYPNMGSQMLVSPTPVGHVGEVDGGNDSLGTNMFKQFDAFCEEWDLENAVNLMEDMGEKGVSIDMPRYVTLMKACGVAKATQEAKAVHKHIMRYVSPVQVGTFNRILEMYGKCGLMEDALSTFEQMPKRNLTSWDTMITWFARNGLGEDAIDMFSRFKDTGLKPDGEMFLGVFDACGVVGDVTEGMLHFESMSKIYGITPSLAHYARIVHMFGSVGYLDRALEFIDNMPIEPSIDVWESLMNISRIQGDLELGDRCALIIENMDASYLTKESKSGLLPVKNSEIPNKKVKKASPLEHRKHEYRAGDRSHPENDKIYATLRGLKEQLKEAGYIPETKFVLHDIDQEGKEEAIMAHSERLAGTYALLTSAARTPIRILKNLRVCNDCHNVFKILSSLVGREVVMRDAKRFHHFKDGKCSCNDYW